MEGSVVLEKPYRTLLDGIVVLENWKTIQNLTGWFGSTREVENNTEPYCLEGLEALEN